MDIKEVQILGSDIKRHWYYVSKGRALYRILRHISAETVLDVGAGSGIFSRQILDQGICKKAVCVDPAYKKEHTELHNGREIRFVRSVDRISPELTLMMDVLEHVSDDSALLRQYTDAMPQGGYILITVPAFQFLWSGHDEFLEHYRRYTLQSLESLVRESNLEIVHSSYFFGALFPVIAMMRLYNKRQLKKRIIKPKSALRKHSKLVNNVLIFVNYLECIFLFPFNRMAGLTIFCLARTK